MLALTFRSRQTGSFPTKQALTLAGLFVAISFLLLAMPTIAAAQAPAPCIRYAPGSVVQNPPDLSDPSGSLTVNFSYHTETDANGLTLFCFTTPGGLESPTLHVSPGGTLTVNVTNDVPPPDSAGGMKMSSS